MTKTNFQKVGDFHTKFHLPSAASEVPKILPDDVWEFRRKFMQEELDETSEAHSAGDIVKFADGLADLLYVAYGTAHLAGIDIDAIFAEVHRANMRKERAVAADDERSTRKHVLDVVKPVGWTPPDIAGVLAKMIEMQYADPETSQLEWDRRLMGLARFVSMWSKDPSTKVGAVVVGENRRNIAVGYNGFPPGIRDSHERFVDRDMKYKLTQHAERNVLDNAQFSLGGATLYVTLPPCTECAKSIVSKGIFRVVVSTTPSRSPTYAAGMATSEFGKLIMLEAGTVVEEIEE
jgi:dCMP deaminase